MQARDPIGSYLVQMEFQGTGYAPPLDLSVTDPLGFVAREAALRGQTVFGALADPPLLNTGGSGPASAGVSDSGIGANPIPGAGVANASLLGDAGSSFLSGGKVLLVELVVLLLAAGIILLGVGGLVPKGLKP